MILMYTAFVRIWQRGRYSDRCGGDLLKIMVYKNEPNSRRLDNGFHRLHSDSNSIVVDLPAKAYHNVRLN